MSQDPSSAAMDTLKQDPDFVLVSKFVEEATGGEDAESASHSNIGKEQLTE